METCGIVGAGIVGQLSAFFLLERGVSSISIYETGSRPPASWAGGGILSPLFPWRYSVFMNQLCDRAVPLYKSICARLQSLGYLPDGALHLSGMWMEVQEDEVEIASAWAASSLLQTCEEERLIGGKSCHGFWFNDLGSIRNPWFLKALRSYLIDKGVVFVSQKVISWSERGGCAALHLESGTAKRFGRLIFACGAWVNELVEFAPVFPVKGEILLYRLGSQAPSHIVLAKEGYVIPRKNGDTLVGSTTRPGDDSTWPTVSGRWQLEKVAKLLLPGLDSAPDCHWAGVRPGTGRDYPYIGKVPNTVNVFLAAGHFRNGLVSAPVTAELIAQLVCGEHSSVGLAPYSLSP